jgi:hypothetical protein
MPRYFFHVRDSSEHIDEDGVELPSLDEARSQAVVAAGEALRDLDGKFWNGEDWRMWVNDETGATVCTLRFTTA